MKKRARILCLLIAALVVFAMLPLQASAKTDYAAVFAGLTGGDVAAYNTPPPAGGKDRTAAQINNTLKKIGYKMPGKGSSLARSTLIIWANNGVVDRAFKTKSWEKASGGTTYYYSEENEIYGAVSTRTSCLFTRTTGNTTTCYMWNKGENTGGSFKDMSSSYVPPMTSCKKYADAYVLGQKCFVYSYKLKGVKGVRHYKYVSRKTGLTMKTVSVYTDGDVHTTVFFVQKKASKAAKYFDKPAGVKFTKI